MTLLHNLRNIYCKRLMKNKKIELAPPDYCTGCSACADVCPTKSIVMSDEGKLFLYPIINHQTCIACGKCMRVCPSINPLQEYSFKQQYFAAWNNDEAERNKSTSGGIGTALAKTAVSLGYAVCGAQFDDSFNVIHKLVQSESEIEHFRGSKYLQSSTVGIYAAVVDYLKDGGKVLFIGTPCQVEAVKRYVPLQLTDYILTCEIVCHGVNSPKVWSDFKQCLQEDVGSSLQSYHFRSKSKGWQRPSGSPNLRVAYIFQNGKSVDIPAWKNQFHYWFGQHYMLRPSCSHCLYRKENRRADLTIADFWGVQHVVPEVDTFKGVSAVIASTEKGLSFIKSVDNISLYPVDESKTKQVLRGFVEQKNKAEQQKEIEKGHVFESEYVVKGFRAMAKKYPHHTELSMFFHKIKCKLGLG